MESPQVAAGQPQWQRDAEDPADSNNIDVSHIVGIDNNQSGAVTIYTDGTDD
jgi:hypothetical protein